MLEFDLEKIEKERKSGVIGLRIPDTMVPMQNSNFIYLLTGNFHNIDGFDDSIKDNEMADALLTRFKQNPHDLLIPYMITKELDGIKDNNKKSITDHVNAISGLRSIGDLIKTSEIYTDSTINRKQFKKKMNDLMNGNIPISLDNGANIYFIKLNKNDIEKKFSDNNYEKPDNDVKIVMCVEKFLEKYDQYENVKIISDDSGMILKASDKGIKVDPFRFEEVKNPLQLNTGVYKIDLGLTIGKKLKKIDFLDPIENKINFKLDKKYITPNNILKISVKDQRKKNEIDVQKEIYKVYDPELETFGPLKYYKEFREFMKLRYYENKSSINISKTENNITQNSPIYFDDTLINSPSHFKEIIIKLKNFKKINVGEFNNYMNMITASKTKKRNKNLIEKVNKVFNKLKECNKISSDENAYKEMEIDNKRFKGVLKFPYNDLLTPLGEQKPYLDHLLNPNIRVLSVDAKGGFGKTLWALAAGTYLVHKNVYDKIIYIGSLGIAEGDIGFRPGDKSSKIADKIMPGKKALCELFTNFERHNIFHMQEVEGYVDSLERDSLLEYDVITDIKGRTYLNTYAIIDESHLFSRDEMGLILGRFGRGSKVITLSAMEQLKSSTKAYGKLNERTAGISHMTELLTEFNEYAHLSASPTEIYRGIIPKMAAKLLKRENDNFGGTI